MTIYGYTKRLSDVMSPLYVGTHWSHSLQPTPLITYKSTIFAQQYWTNWSHMSRLWTWSCALLEPS